MSLVSPARRVITHDRTDARDRRAPQTWLFDQPVAAKTDFSDEYVNAICYLLDNGEERLLLPSEASCRRAKMERSSAKDTEIQEARRGLRKKTIPGTDPRHPPDHRIGGPLKARAWLAAHYARTTAEETRHCRLVGSTTVRRLNARSCLSRKLQ
jgi:hypothetical protein